MDSLRLFLTRYRLVRFAKGEIIIHQNEPPTAYYVHSGIVKSYDLTINGEEKPIDFLQAGGVFPVDWVFSKQHASYYYEALTDCRLYAIPRQDYLDLIKTNSTVALELCAYLAECHSIHSMRVNALEQSKAADKVSHTINYLAYSFGQPDGLGEVRITIPLTQYDLANFMGLSRETTSIGLKKLERQGILTYEYPHYIINIERLNALLNIAENAYANPENAYAKTNS